MRKKRILILLCWLCLGFTEPVFAQALEGHWESRGLITELYLSHNGNDDSITLSNNSIETMDAFKADRVQLRHMQYKIPVKVLITVDEATKATQTMILSSERFVYNIVLQYDPRNNQFEVIWFDRHNLEVPTTQQFLR